MVWYCWVSPERLQTAGPAQPVSYNVTLRYSKLLLQGGSVLGLTLIARAGDSFACNGGMMFRRVNGWLVILLWTARRLESSSSLTLDS